MHEDPSWRRWLEALADPGIPCAITVAGTVSSRSWDMGRRILPDHMLHAVLVGGHRGTVGGQEVATSPGDALWVPAGTVQVLRQAPGHFRKIYVRFRCPAPFPLLGAWHRPLPGAALVLDRIRREHLAGQPGHAVLVRSLLVEFMVSWMRGAQAADGLPPEVRQRIVAAVAADPGRRWHPAALAGLAGMSPSWFARRFRGAFGMSPRAWLVDQRIRCAARMLAETPGPVDEVAGRLGYADRFLFTRQFTRIMGVPPRAWRGIARD